MPALTDPDRYATPTSDALRDALAVLEAEAAVWERACAAADDIAQELHEAVGDPWKVAPPETGSYAAASRRTKRAGEEAEHFAALAARARSLLDDVEHAERRHAPDAMPRRVLPALPMREAA